MSKKVKIDLTGTYEDSMNEIDNANITDELKVHLRKEYHKIYDNIGNLMLEREVYPGVFRYILV